jgi:hypothetical protein
MDVLTAILACSLYRDEGLVRAIAETNSHGNPYAVIDATFASDADAPRPQPRSFDAAVALATDVSKLGGEPLLGLMQVPAAWASVYGKEGRDLFDPCLNIAIGTAKLSDLDYECWRAEVGGARSNRRAAPRFESASTTRRRCVVHKYAAAIHMPEFEIVLRLELEHQRAAPITRRASNSPVLFETCSSSSRAASHCRLLFTLLAEDDGLVDPFEADPSVEALGGHSMFGHEGIARANAERSLGRVDHDH